MSVKAKESRVKILDHEPQTSFQTSSVINFIIKWKIE